MAGQGGIRAARAYVELFADDGKLRQGLNRASRSLKDFSAKVGRIGAGFLAAGSAIVAPLTIAVKKFADLGDQIDKMSARTGVSASALSELGFAAEQSGSDIETVEKGLKGMARTLLNADQGLTSSVDSLKELGLASDDLNGRSPDEQFGLLAEAISRVEDPTKKAGLAMRIFGRAGSDLIPLFDAGADGIAAMRAEARELGIALTDEDAVSAAKATDAMNRFWKSLRGVALQIGAAVAPALESIANTAAKAVARIVEFVRENRNIVNVAAAVGVVLIAVGGVLVTIAGAATGFALVLSGLSSALGLMLSPLALVTAAVVGGGTAFLFFSESGRQVVDYLKAKVASLWEYIQPTFEAITNALSSGEYGAAAEILWLQLKSAWMTGTATLKKYWAAFKVEAAKMFIEVTTDSANTWDNFIDGLLDAWDFFSSNIVNSWRDLQSIISGFVIRVMGYFDDSINVEEAIADVNKQVSEENADRTDAAYKRIMDRENQRKRDVAAREQAGADATGELDDQLERDLAEIDKDVAKAKSDLDKARSKYASPEVAEDAAKEEGKSFADILNGVVAGASAGLSSAAGASPSGSFSIVAGRQLGIDYAAKQYEALRQVAANTKAIADKEPEGAFG